MKKFLLFLVLVLLFSEVRSQQLPQFTSYQLSPFLYNPAYAGVDKTTQINAVIRNQWSGVRDAPQTDIISGYGLLRNETMALGGTAFKDVAGADSRRGITASYAYHLKINSETNLSLGLSAGFLQYRLDHTIINPYDDGDPIFNNSILSSVVPTASFGAYFFTEDYYASLSAPQLLTSNFNINEKYEDNIIVSDGLTSHIYLSGGYHFKQIDDFVITPSLLLMIAPPAPVAVELMAKVTYKDFLWSALSYRLSDAVSLYVGVDINDRFYIAYSHDFLTSELSSVSSGTNEFKLGFRFNKPQ